MSTHEPRPCIESTGSVHPGPSLTPFGVSVQKDLTGQAIKLIVIFLMGFETSYSWFAMR